MDESGIWSKMSLGNGIYRKFGLENGIYLDFPSQDPQSFQLGIFCLSSFIQIIYLLYIPIFSSVLLMGLISFSCSLV